MDVMMVLSTDDVKRLQAKFVRPLKLDEFVYIMMKCLHEHIIDELTFVMSVIELYETIDVNGDGELEWDEFAGYIVDAGIAKAEEAISAQALAKLYSPLVFKGSAINTIQPVVANHSYIEQIIVLQGRQALAYFEHAMDVVHVYLFDVHRDAEPRFASAIRLHTAYQAHQILHIEDIPTRSALAISSVLTTGCITLWDVARLYNPIPLHRIEMAVGQERLAWVPTHQLLIATTTQSTYTNKQTTYVAAFDIATLNRVPLDVPTKHVMCVCVLKRSTRSALALGSLDGTITIHDVAKKSHAEPAVVLDAHEKGVKALVYSVKFHYLASIGHYSFAEETTMEIWHLDELDAGHLDQTLCGHHAALCAITAVDTESHLVSSDESGTFRVWATTNWSCLQVFHTTHVNVLRTQLVWPATAQTDALLLGAGKTIEFHDYTLAREREDFVFLDFNATFHVVVGVTYRRLILWDVVSGNVKKTYDLPMKCHGEQKSVTAVCLDDRERKLIVGDDSGHLLVVNLINGNVMKELDPHDQAITSLVYVASAKCVISTAMDSTLHVCDENSAQGYYVPYAVAPLSVLLRSLRFVKPQPSRRQTIAAVPSLPNVEIDLTSSVASNAWGLFATVTTVTGAVVENHIHVWDFHTAALVGTCIAPDPTIEIHCVAFLDTFRGLVAGLSSGDVFVWSLQSPFRCVFHLQQPSKAAITTILTEEAPGMFIFAGDEGGRISRWTLSHQTCISVGLEDTSAEFPADQDASPEQETSRHTHSNIAWDALAKSVRSAKLGNATTPPEAVTSDLCWHLDGAISRLAKVECTATVWSLLTSITTGKIFAWSVDGEAQGTLDYFATRRHPGTSPFCIVSGLQLHEPWRVPVDATRRQQRQAEQAKALLRHVRTVDATRKPNQVKTDNQAQRAPRSTSARPSSINTPRTSSRYDTLAQLAAKKAKEREDATLTDAPLDVVLHEIGKLSQVTHGQPGVMRKKRTIKTVEGILEKSASMPTLHSQHNDDHTKQVANAAKHAGRRPDKQKLWMLPPLVDMRQETNVQPRTKGPTASTSQSVLSYHMKLAHAWQQ
ncbi:unnamed protein product [Aphanomyces euteiches]